MDRLYTEEERQNANAASPVLLADVWSVVLREDKAVDGLLINDGQVVGISMSN